MGGSEQKELYYIDAEGNQFKVNDIQNFTSIATNLFDKEETYTNCTVQILTNTITGEMSIGWWRN